MLMKKTCQTLLPLLAIIKLLTIQLVYIWVFQWLDVQTIDFQLALRKILTEYETVIRQVYDLLVKIRTY